MSDDHPFSTITSAIAADTALSPDGTRLYVAGDDGNLRVYDVATATLLATWDVGIRLGAIDISADGSFLMVVEREPLAVAGSGSPPDSQTVTTYKVSTADGAVQGFPVVMEDGSGPWHDVAILANGEILLTQSYPSAHGLWTLDSSTGAYAGVSGDNTAGILTASADRSHVLLAPLNASGAALYVYEQGAGIVARGSRGDSGGPPGGFNVGIQAISDEAGRIVQGPGLSVFDLELHWLFDLSSIQPEAGNPVGLVFDAAGDNLYILSEARDEIVQVSTESWTIVRRFYVGTDVDGSLDGDFGNRLLLSADESYFTVVTGTGVHRVENFALSTVPGSAGADTIAGTEAAEAIAGLAGDDALAGGGGHDTIDGGDGDDQLAGGDGDDTLIGGAGDDVFAGGAGIDIILGGAGTDTVDYSADTNALGVIVNLSANSYLDPGHPDEIVVAPGQALDGSRHLDRITGVENARTGDFADWAFGNAGANRLETGAGDDRLNGGAGDDVLDGGAGSDNMIGGSGNDIYVVDSVTDILAEVPGAGIDTVELTAPSYTLQSHIENAVALFDGTGPAQTIHGNAVNNRLTGSTGNDVLSGRSGDDLLVGGAGIDIVTGGAGHDVAIGGSLSGLELIVNGSFETIGGTDSARDVILANGLDAGNYRTYTTPSLYGWQTGTADGVELHAGTGTFSGFNTGDGAVLVDLETDFGKNQTLIQDVAGVAAGAPLLLSFAAAAPITGGAQLEVRWNGSVIATITPTSNAMAQYSFLVTGVAAGTGAGGANRLEFRELGTANRGGTLLDAVSLRSIVDDGEDDWLSYDSEVDGGPAGVLVNLSGAGAVLDGILVAAGQARDTNGQFDTIIGFNNVAAADMGYSWVLGSQGSNFIIGGNGDDVLDGAGGDDRLDGGHGDDRLTGGSGADIMSGGTGDDVFEVDDALDTVVENSGEGVDEVRTSLAVYSLAGSHLENLTAMSSIAHQFRGSAASNILIGAAGNDVLLLQDGGDDSAQGGAGNDVLYLGTALSAGDVADGGEGRDAVVFQGNVAAVLTDTNLAGIESISIQSGANAFFGDTANAFYDYDVTTADGNVLVGQQMIVNAQSLRVGEDFIFDGSAETDGKFVVYAGHGIDDLTGGDGADVFFFEGQRWGPNDRVDGGDGRDSVAISAGSGLAHIEFGADSLTNIESISLNNFFASDPSQKPSYELVLHNGNVASGGTLIVNGSSIPLGQVVNIDGSGVDDGNLMLFAGGGHDVLTGGDGGDLILGGGGADSLTGGAGADTFRYDSVSDSAGFADLIGDFQTGTDKIDLSRIDANSHSAGNQAFSWIGSAAFSGSGAGSAGELRLFEEGGYQRIAGDTDGDGLADLLIVLQIGTPMLGQGDFLL